MKELLLQVLATLGVPVYLQGSIAEDEALPELYITFLTVDSPSVADFDNATALTAWRYQVSIYGVDPKAVATKASNARTALKGAGFIPIGKGRDLPSGEPNYTAWTCDYYKLENEIGGIKNE